MTDTHKLTYNEAISDAVQILLSLPDEKKLLILDAIMAIHKLHKPYRTIPNEKVNHESTTQKVQE